MIRRIVLAAVIASAVLVASYGIGAPSPPVTAKVALPTLDSAAVALVSQSQRLNLDDLFPPGAGRVQVLDQCTNCHEVTLFTLLRKSPDAWMRIRANHAQRFPKLSDAEIETMYDYVVVNFNPDRPLTQLPPALRWQVCGT